MGLLPLFHALQKKAWCRLELTDTQQRMYTAEKLENFRWISKLIAAYSSYELKEEDIVDEDLVLWLREVGQFAEVVYATPPLDALLGNYGSLRQPGFPFEGYYALSPQPYASTALSIHSAHPFSKTIPEQSATSSGVRLLKSIKGNVAKLPAAVFSRWIHKRDCAKPELSRTETERKADEIDPKQGPSPCSCPRRRQQIIISICGTSSVRQAIHDLRAIRRPYPGAPDSAATVHTGFWDLYQGMRSALMDGIHAGLQLDPEQLPLNDNGKVEFSNSSGDVVRELVVTGHSMGGAVAHLLCMDLLSPYSNSTRPTRSSSLLSNHKSSRSSGSTPQEPIPSVEVESELPDHDQESYLQRLGIQSLQIITFGEPRTGNQALVDHWVNLKKRHEVGYGIPIREWCMKAYNDGVPALPLMGLGYRHFAQQPLYTVNGKVYRVPASEREFALFRVAPTDPDCGSSGTASPIPCDPQLVPGPLTSNPYQVALPMPDPPIPLSPLGGHNYYNERDLEGGFLRRMEWLAKSGFSSEASWEDRYRIIMEKHFGKNGNQKCWLNLDMLGWLGSP